MAGEAGKIIRKERKKQQMTQKELAEKCGMTDAAIRKYELGKLSPKFETVEKISKALNLRLKDFYPQLFEDPTAKWEYAKNLAWVSPDRRTTEPVVRCSNCHASMSESDYLRYIWNYCPVCGKKMEDADDD